MKEQGIVVGIIGNTVQVQFKASRACDKCGACMLKGGGIAEVTAYNNVNAQAGDMVVVEVLERQVVWASFVIFILPLLAMMAGYFFGSYFSGKLVLGADQNYGILFSVSFLAASLIGLNIYDRALSSRGRASCRIVEIVRSKEGKT